MYLPIHMEGRERICFPVALGNRMPINISRNKISERNFLHNFDLQERAADRFERANPGPKRPMGTVQRQKETPEAVSRGEGSTCPVFRSCSFH